MMRSLLKNTAYLIGALLIFAAVMIAGAIFFSLLHDAGVI